MVHRVYLQKRFSRVVDILTALEERLKKCTDTHKRSLIIIRMHKIEKYLVDLKEQYKNTYKYRDNKSEYYTHVPFADLEFEVGYSLTNCSDGFKINSITLIGDNRDLSDLLGASVYKDIFQHILANRGGYPNE